MVGVMQAVPDAPGTEIIPYRAPATEARAKRYTATPLGTSDRKHLIGLIQNTTGRVAP